MKQRLLTCALWGGLLMAGSTNAQTCTNTNMTESTPTSRYTFGAGGVVTDNTTGLMWKRCLEGQTFSDNGTPSNYLDDACTGSATGLDWQEALGQAQTANAANDGGHNDWRVPNLKELESTVEYCRVGPALNTEVFPGSDDGLWSGSPLTYPGYEPYAWSVLFDGGTDLGGDRNDGRAVRLVRSGQ
ncbi:DUF1566 domain-containing protein [Candidatus Thiothrix sp. Deng01]|uniref:DUF1566 domain-containing protein n=1 Tax=Candidatus Thiothrix phosphatis TaxID=3112415 RepID=A0ABU6CUP6_9GAMM|nr:DUF1566 domain-containing protein [Candidatus Thiothrix sp. Deng01]MEB4590560.1 DUF1566 domain-containing protein [Candidatus Thiothrix sp. Deng01]